MYTVFLSVGAAGSGNSESNAVAKVCAQHHDVFFGLLLFVPPWTVAVMEIPAEFSESDYLIQLTNKNKLFSKLDKFIVLLCMTMTEILLK